MSLQLHCPMILSALSSSACWLHLQTGFPHGHNYWGNIIKVIPECDMHQQQSLRDYKDRKKSHPLYRQTDTIHYIYVICY